MKCRACPKVAVLHITEVLEDGFEELHFCEDCGRRYLYRPAVEDDVIEEFDLGLEPDLADSLEADAMEEPNAAPCEVCGMKFVEFRNSGRLGCAHDYDHFREDLLSLLESIHGDVKHAGKRPQRTPKPAGALQELSGLRRQLQDAVKEEDYENAAQLRDQIRHLEQS
jgi:protein arginine kinase activator